MRQKIMGLSLMILAIVLSFPLIVVAQQPRRDFLPEFQRDQLVHERAMRRASEREYRANARRQSCGQRWEWYMGSDGFWIRSY